jgi:hypothetical protein
MCNVRMYIFTFTYQPHNFLKHSLFSDAGTPQLTHSRTLSQINPILTFPSSVVTMHSNTRFFKYDRDYLCVNKSQFVPVIFEPPCIFQSSTLNHFKQNLSLSIPVHFSYIPCVLHAFPCSSALISSPYNSWQKVRITIVTYMYKN